MLRFLAIQNYRSLKDLKVPLANLTVVSGANGSGKSSLYRSLKLLSEIVKNGALTSLSAEGGFKNVLFSGEKSQTESVQLQLGFAGDDFSYAIDLGVPSLPIFPFDPEVKSELIWHGAVLRPSAVLAQRKGTAIQILGSSGNLEFQDWKVSPQESMLATIADPAIAPELFTIRESAKQWRFYDQLRSDFEAPARKAAPITFSPVLDGDGRNLSAAIATILNQGESEFLQQLIAETFDAAEVAIISDTFGLGRVALSQPGNFRPFTAEELSDGTLKFLMLSAALLSTRPPELLVLNEPESSLHPGLIPALTKLIIKSSEHSQIIVISHSEALLEGLAKNFYPQFNSAAEFDEDQEDQLESRADEFRWIKLEKESGESKVRNQSFLDQASWQWPKR